MPRQALPHGVSAARTSEGGALNSYVDCVRCLRYFLRLPLRPLLLVLCVLNRLSPKTCTQSGDNAQCERNRTFSTVIHAAVP